MSVKIHVGAVHRLQTVPGLLGSAQIAFSLIHRENVSVIVRRVHYLVSLRYKYDQPDNYQTTYDSKTKIVVYYSLSSAFDVTSVSTFRENIDPNSNL